MNDDIRPWSSYRLNYQTKIKPHSHIQSSFASSLGFLAIAFARKSGQVAVIFLFINFWARRKEFHWWLLIHCQD
ncbi:hypothetical protein EYR41_008776 [Orbilia oligospora]|uniref:Uncharacterized protein n=1 Tax=Orbilia oligospora TaxID=2813651 RepID=A0A8H2DYN5_ORBOL|nr:hypothetical protein EYR41_008776 [Orbilia oligospora]